MPDPARAAHSARPHRDRLNSPVIRLAVVVFGAPVAIPCYVRGTPALRQAAVLGLITHLGLLVLLNPLRVAMILASSTHPESRALVDRSLVIEGLAAAFWLVMALVTVFAPAAGARSPVLGPVVRVADTWLSRLLAGLGIVTRESTPARGEGSARDVPERLEAMSPRALAGIALLALALRVPMLWWGLPLEPHRYQIHPDEHGVVSQAKAWPLTGPRAVVPQYPSLLGALIANGTPITMAALTVQQLHATPLRVDVSTAIVGRLISIAISVLGALALALAAATLFPEARGAGLIAGIGLATAIAPTHGSVFLTGDGAAAGWVACALLACAWILQTGARSAYTLAGLFTGLAAATKYIAVVVAASVAVAWLTDGVSRRRLRADVGRWIRDGAVAAIVGVIVFVVANPVVVFAPASLATTLSGERVVLANHAAAPLGDYLAFVVAAFRRILGAPLAALLLIAIAGWRWRRGALLVCIVPPIVVILAARGFYDRHITALAPFALLSIALGLTALRRSRIAAPISWTSAALLMLAIADCAGTVYQRTFDLRQSRAVVDDLAQRLTPGSRVYVPAQVERVPAILANSVTVDEGASLALDRSWTDPRYLLIDDESYARESALLPLLDRTTYRVPDAAMYRVFNRMAAPPEYFRILDELRARPDRARYHAVARWEQPLARLPLDRAEFLPTGFTLYEKRSP